MARFGYTTMGHKLGFGKSVSIHLLATVFLPAFLLAAPDSVQLHYLPSQPVMQRSSVEVEMTQGHRSESTTARQEIKARMAIAGTPQEKIVVKPPMNLSITLESLQVGVESKGRSLHFDSGHPEGSPLMLQIAKVIDKPLTVVVGSNLQIEAESKAFKELSQSLEQLGGFRTTNMLSEMLQNLFALAGRDLRVGDTHTIKLSLGADENVPMILSYTIAGITDSEVRAVVHGGFDEVQIIRAATAVQHADPERMIISGKIDGKAVWSRKNALIHKTRIDYVYSGILEQGGEETPIRLHLHHEGDSRPATT